MSVVSDQVLQYPFVHDDGLEVDRRYAEMQTRGPVRVQMAYGGPAWLATRYADVRTIYSDRRFSRVLPAGTEASNAFRGASLVEPTFPLGMDPPQHTRLRRITAPVFSPRQIRTLTDDVQALVDERLDEMVEQGPGADFHTVVSWELPIAVLVGILGIPRPEAPMFREWVRTSSEPIGPAEPRLEAYGHMRAYVASLIALRRAEHHDDLLGLLVDARDEGDRLTEEELFGLTLSLVAGGFHTTTMQLSNTVVALMTHRERWQELLDGRAELGPALEELWRWIPSFHYGSPMTRWAREDVELSGGVVVRAGEAVLPEQAVANRDEAAFPNGWEIDFHRVDPPPHLALGFGEHLCMGLHLAKLQLELTVRTLLRRFPTLELAVPADQISWPVHGFLRSPDAVPLTW
jgi:cytochrome P450 RapN